MFGGAKNRHVRSHHDKMFLTQSSEMDFWRKNGLIGRTGMG